MLNSAEKSSFEVRCLGVSMCISVCVSVGHDHVAQTIAGLSTGFRSLEFSCFFPKQPQFCSSVSAYSYREVKKV